MTAFHAMTPSIARDSNRPREPPLNFEDIEPSVVAD